MASLPSTYKAVVIKEANGPFTVEDVELKHPGPGEVLIKSRACGVCYSDVAIGAGLMGNSFPVTPGHEVVGDIVELGAGVTRFELGQRVGGAWHGGHDGHCRACQRSQFVMCDNEEINGVTRPGGFAEYVLLRAEAAVRIPSDFDPAQVAPLLCAGVTVFNSMRKMHIEQGGLVAVQGLGGLGHLAVQYARNMGYEVAVLSSGDDKEGFARELGAHHYINNKTKDVVAELNKLGGADMIVQTAPSPKALTDLLSGLAPCGKLVSLAPVGNVEFSTVTMIQKGVSVHGWPAGHALDAEEAIHFAKTHNIKCLIETFPFSDVQKAVDSLVAGKPRFRNVLVME